MMLWCDICKEAVEPVEHYEYDIPDANVGGYEKWQVLTCPCCHNEVYQDPGACVMCGELIAPGETLCGLCSDEIVSAVNFIAEYKNIDARAVWRGITEYMDR